MRKLNYLKIKCKFSLRLKKRVKYNASHRCVMCFSNKNNLTVSHIISGSPLGPRSYIKYADIILLENPKAYLSSIDNARCLCSPCHIKVDKYHHFYNRKFMSKLPLYL